MYSSSSGVVELIRVIIRAEDGESNAIAGPQ